MNANFKILHIPVILASKSPRRLELMQQAGFKVKIVLADEIDEQYPPELQREEIPLFLAKLKADAFFRTKSISDETVVVTADTIVWINNQTLGKPAGRQEAIEMLETLSDNIHYVYTGVCLTSNNKQRCFCDESKVFFRKLSYEEITYYVDNYHPFDKAGAYGIQEWLGMVGIEKIEGSYSNIVGLPVEKVYCELREFFHFF